VLRVRSRRPAGVEDRTFARAALALAPRNRHREEGSSHARSLSLAAPGFVQPRFAGGSLEPGAHSGTDETLNTSATALIASRAKSETFSPG
jgi:hypothetical protein